MKLLPKNILAIDDSLTLRKFIEKSLVHEECVSRLLLAPDALTGLELATTTLPDLIICDYTLPDMLGDELCRRLAANPTTAQIPVILVSSSGPEISGMTQREPNIVRLLVKPFSKELLVATVTYVLSHAEQKQEVVKTASTVGAMLIRGNTDGSPMCSALRYIEQRHLTGVLRASVRDKTVHAFCEGGSIRVISTRNVDAYLEGTPFLTNGKKSAIWKKCEAKQRETLSPFVLNLSQEGILPTQTAQTLTQLYGHRLFSRIWTEQGVNYEFEETVLPPFVELCTGAPMRMNDWILESLRNVDASEEIRTIEEDLEGVPVFTPTGYRQLPEIKPHNDEWQILSLITGSTPLNEICRRLKVRPDSAARKIFYYQRLGFLDYWPSCVLHPQN